MQMIHFDTAEIYRDTFPKPDGPDTKWNEVDPTRGPSWGHPMVVLGTIRSFLEPFCGHLSPNVDKVSEELTLRYPHEGPCVGDVFSSVAHE